LILHPLQQFVPNFTGLARRERLGTAWSRAGHLSTLARD
jgi:hypothetical protein